MISDAAVTVAAERLDRAVLAAKAVPQFGPGDGIDVESGYAVQHRGIELRTGRGERPVGVKLGFTSRAKMAQMGVDDVIVGQLTGAMRVDDGADLDLAGLIHPRIEPEVAYRLGRDVEPDEPLEDLYGVIDAVAPALEIIDSRYAAFRFSLADVVADNTSAARFVVGPWRAPDIDLANRAVVLSVDAVPVEIGSTAAILGSPTRTFGALLAMARRHRIPLRRGFVVLAGAATAAVPLGAGSVDLRVAGLGRVAVQARGSANGD
jgi:2-oxo-3-hexenedioate decarboxylase